LIFDSTCSSDPFAGLSNACVAKARAVVAAYALSLDALMHSAMPDSLGLDYEQSLRPSMLAVPLGSSVRELGKLACAQSFLNAIDGDHARAVGHIELQLALSELLYGQPVFMLALAAIANDALAIRSLEALLAVGELETTDLQRLAVALARADASQTLADALRRQRADSLVMTDTAAMEEFFADLQHRLNRSNRTRLPTWEDFFPFSVDWFLMANRSSMVSTWDRLVQSSATPTELLAAASAEEAAISRYASRQQLLRTSIPSLRRSIELHARAVGLIRAARAAIAAEQFRAAVGRFPTSLAELVPDYLDRVPLDPFDGAPLRIAQIASGIVIYTIGDDLLDDGGAVAPAGGARAHDFGIRLLDTPARGIQITGANSAG
jgi:hypothetical protein